MPSSLRTIALAVLGSALAACPSSDDSDSNGDTAGPSTAADAGSADESSADGGGGSNLTWGAPCTADAECVALIGPGAICQNMAVIYELPGGYCTKPCTLPDATSTVVEDDPTCDPAGGVDCIGSSGFFENCAKSCSSDADCDGRDLYSCRQMPMIAQPTDPTYCLMADCCQADCTDC